MRSSLVVGNVILLFAGPAQAETANPPAPASMEARVDHRFGFDGVSTLGVIAGVGGSLRYEHRVQPEGYLTFRVGMIDGVVIEAEDDGFRAPLAQLGYRAYWGGFYLSAEIGATVMLQRPYNFEGEMKPGKATPLPSGNLSLGGKIGAVDIGLTTMFPFLGLGVTLGIDFTSG